MSVPYARRVWSGSAARSNAARARLEVKSSIALRWKWSIVARSRERSRPASWRSTSPSSDVRSPEPVDGQLGRRRERRQPWLAVRRDGVVERLILVELARNFGSQSANRGSY